MKDSHKIVQSYIKKVVRVYLALFKMDIAV